MNWKVKLLAAASYKYLYSTPLETGRSFIGRSVVIVLYGYIYFVPIRYIVHRLRIHTVQLHFVRSLAGLAFFFPIIFSLFSSHSKID